MIGEVNNYSMIQTKNKELEQRNNELNILKEKLENYFKFEIPSYIVDDIIEKENYNHFCLMVNLSVKNNRLSNENGETLKVGIKNLYNIKNIWDRF